MMKTWTTIDKSDYVTKGVWNNEPDKAHWIDKETGFDCLIVRSQSSGGLCGYVGVPETHNCFNRPYDEIENIEAHGGLTFSDICMDGFGEDRGVCHPKQGAANDVVWWLGFDCAHCYDISPKYDIAPPYDATYKNFNYVKREVVYLAKQLKEANK